MKLEPPREREMLNDFYYSYFILSSFPLLSVEFWGSDYHYCYYLVSLDTATRCFGGLFADPSLYEAPFNIVHLVMLYIFALEFIIF